MGNAFRQTLGELLLEKGIVDKKTLENAISDQKKNGKRLGKILQEKGYLDEEGLYSFLEDQLGVEFVREINDEFHNEVFQAIPYEFCRNRLIAPIVLPGHRLKVYISEPTNTALLNEISFLSGRKVEAAYARESAIQDYLSRHAASRQTQGTATSAPAENKPSEAPAERVAAEDDASPVVRFVTEVILHAIEQKVSDIHLEIYEKEARLRYRIDGVLHNLEAPDIRLYPAIISRLKILAELDISEKRLPQDGRILFQFYSRPIDIRVSIIPTVYGENAVLRILDKGRALLSIDDVGFSPQLLELVRREAKKPFGMILVTGPTGSGKTTTLYAILEHLRKTQDNKILTIEDPVEYQIPGICQVQVHSEIGLTFAAGLRSFLRHDPDVIMVGEIRDRDTAEIAVRSSLTGHLVLSTVHTNDAASTLTRFTDMGIPPYLLTSTINLIIAQRLVRKICPHCKTEKQLTETEIADWQLEGEFKPGDTVYYGKGCKQCSQTGYKGRAPIFEWIRITENLKRAVLNGASSLELRQAAKEEGMPILKDFGLDRVREGLTTIEEIEKIASLGE